MSEMRKVDPALRWFVARMRQKLAMKKNLQKTHWLDGEDWYLFDRLKEETRELVKAWRDIELDESKRAEVIIDEAADVANFAMMIADYVRAEAGMRRRKPKGHPMTPPDELTRRAEEEVDRLAGIQMDRLAPFYDAKFIYRHIAVRLMRLKLQVREAEKLKRHDLDFKLVEGK